MIEYLEYQVQFCGNSSLFTNNYTCIICFWMQRTLQLCKDEEYISVSLSSPAVLTSHSLFFFILTPLVSFKGNISILSIFLHFLLYTSSTFPVFYTNTFSSSFLYLSFFSWFHSLFLVFRKMYCP